MIIKMPMVTPSTERKVRNLFCLNESFANKKLYLSSFKNSIFELIGLSLTRRIRLHPGSF
jgi:hypothetical protein